MDYIVLDLEWNQAVDGKEGENEKIPFEIIEIGAIKLNSDYEEISRFSQVIKPEVYLKMHHVMKQLVHINKDELMQGKPFRDVAASFMEWCFGFMMFRNCLVWLMMTGSQGLHWKQQLTTLKWKKMLIFTEHSATHIIQPEFLGC